MSFYLTLKCDKQSHDLDKHYNLQGEWEMGVCQVIATVGPEEPNVVWVLCDLVEFSNYNDYSVPLLDVINLKKQGNMAKPTYVKLARNNFSRINIIFKTGLEYDSEYIFKDLHLRIHFRKF
jgi:hypothetical protein